MSVFIKTTTGTKENRRPWKSTEVKIKRYDRVII